MVERWTLYLTTPMLSVAGPQLSEIWPRPPVALSVPGALGGVVSGEVIEVFMSAWISAALQRAVVDADLVDQAVEPLAPDRVAADLERAGGRWRSSR